MARALGKDFVAGLINAVVSVPDGLPSAALAGVTLIYRLYTSIAAPSVGSLLMGAQLMQISTTSGAPSAARSTTAGCGARWGSADRVVIALLDGAAGAQSDDRA